jgi:hypothetical protein
VVLQFGVAGETKTEEVHEKHHGDRLSLSMKMTSMDDIISAHLMVMACSACGATHFVETCTKRITTLRQYEVSV